MQRGEIHPQSLQCGSGELNPLPRSAALHFCRSALLPLGKISSGSLLATYLTLQCPCRYLQIMSEPPNTCHGTCEAAAFKAPDVQSEPQSNAARACNRVQQPTTARTADLSLQLHILCFGKLLEWDSRNVCIPVCISCASLCTSLCASLCAPLCTSPCICICRSQSTAGHGSVALLALCRGQTYPDPRGRDWLTGHYALWTSSKPPLPFSVSSYSAKVGQALLMCLSGCLQAWQEEL